jgi:hypothetical protein
MTHDTVLFHNLSKVVDDFPASFFEKFRCQKLAVDIYASDLWYPSGWPDLRSRFSSLRSLSFLLNYSCIRWMQDEQFDNIDVDEDFQDRTQQYTNLAGVPFFEYADGFASTRVDFMSRAKETYRAVNTETMRDMLKSKSITGTPSILTFANKETWAAEKLHLKAKLSRSEEPTQWTLKPIERLPATSFSFEMGYIGVLSDEWDYGLVNLFTEPAEITSLEDDEREQQSEDSEIMITLKADVGMPYWWHKRVGHGSRHR